MSTKISRLEQDFQELRTEQKDFVTMKHFDAVVEPLRQAMVAVQKDVKEILRAVSSNSSHSHR